MSHEEWERRWKKGYELTEKDDDNCVRIELVYPRCNKILNKIEIGLSDVRAADSIQIFYDFDRDGWSIQQASTFSWAVEDTKYDEDWQEVAFIQAWGRRKPTPFDDDYEEDPK